MMSSLGNTHTHHISGEVESPTDLLSELQELSYPATWSSPDAFSPFIDGCQKVGRPVPAVIRCLIDEWF
jgi:hypothetical protein